MTQTKPLKIIQCSDLHLFPNSTQTLMGVNTEVYWQQVLALAMQQHPDAALLLLTGDLAQQADNSVYSNLATTLSNLTIPSLCLPGNHDNWKLMKNNLNRPRVSCNKIQCFSDWQIIALNSQIPGHSGGHINDAELDVMVGAIEQHPNLNVLLTFHHHCIASGSDWMDTMQIDNSKEILEKCRKFPQIKVITYGHIHQTQESQFESINIYSSPATCFQFKPFSKAFAVDFQAPGYRWFELHPNGQINTDIDRLNVDMHELNSEAGGY